MHKTKESNVLTFYAGHRRRCTISLSLSKELILKNMMRLVKKKNGIRGCGEGNGDFSPQLAALETAPRLAALHWRMRNEVGFYRFFILLRSRTWNKFLKMTDLKKR